ncbi:MAG TPA: tRNA (adenosine(37)-N6)-threonylcarbamoyltransferase complex transferase subunit TsaD, partial [Quisquiliibacterium sp.]|nr:tRNA (adenosine(37)-N6)-threonylcarbamoyltransferase complex transferase subunit TsaD [Quisquiliibacterium sp.]
DKSAKLLGLGYPGGPAIARLAQSGRPGRVRLPRPMLHSNDLDFSFSGLKTAVLTTVKRGLADEAARADLACELQAAIVDVLVAKSLAALEATGLTRLVIAGGVSANLRLREQLAQARAASGIDVYFPAPALCTDNGAMIAFAGALRLAAASAAPAVPDAFSVRPRWALDALPAIDG